MKNYAREEVGILIQKTESAFKKKGVHVKGGVITKMRWRNNTWYSELKYNKIVLFYILESRRINLMPTEEG
jgi:hypothetical protein